MHCSGTMHARMLRSAAHARPLHASFARGGGACSKAVPAAPQDPLTAAKLGAPADYDLYWNNKLKKPLLEILTTCLSQAQLQARTPQHLAAP